MKSLCSIILLLISLNSFSQIYNSKELFNIGTLLEKSKLNLDFIQENDTNNIIIHLGMPIFNNSAKKLIDIKLARFCERINLHLRLMNNKERYQYLKDNKIDVDYNNFFNIDSSLDFRIDNFDNYYSISWQKDTTDVCKISFEKNFSLITGLNIQESQQLFYKELIDSNIVYKKPSKTINLVKDSLFWINKGEPYIIESMSSDLFYSKKQKPICDTNYPIQSLINIFGGIVKSNAILNITQNFYGYKKGTYQVPLNRFVEYCLSQNCNFYFGIEEYKEHKIKATIIYENKDFGYNHLVFLKDLKDDFLNKENITINCDLNTYIPIHNLKDLYYELNSKEK